MRPAEEKSVDRPESTAQISVFAACFRNHGTEFGERERAKNRENGADNPCGKNNGNVFAFARHFRGLQENARADHGADNDGRGGPSSQAAHQFQAFFAHVPFSSLREEIEHVLTKGTRGGGRPYERQIRLTNPPTANVTQAPMRTYHVNATDVKRKTHKMAARPANIPIRAPRAPARGSRVPSRKRPSRLPKGSEATVSPVSSSGPHFTRPKPMSTRPQRRVMRRERRRNRAGSGLRPRKREKSRTLEAASEFNEPLALDMATATIEASIRPASPTGISRTRKRGRIRSLSSPTTISGECCANTYNNTPIRRNTMNWKRTMTPLVSSARRLSR